MFIAAVFIITKIWNLPRYPSTDECVGMGTSGRRRMKE
jgi:hypothetical protein